jgi:cell division protein FtsI/penicillin-binding protein 2
MSETYRSRLLLMAALLLLFAVALMARLVQYQVVEYKEKRAAAEAMHSKKTEIAPRRGNVLDRHGRILATSLREDYVIGDPEFFRARSAKQQDEIVAKTSAILNVPAEQIRQKLMAGQEHYVVLQERVPLTITKTLADANLSPSITIDSKVRRVYPMGALAAHTLGFVTDTGEGLGIEWSHNEALKGVPGYKLYEPDQYGSGIAKVPVISEPQDGADITLTIDLPIQYKVERELELALAAEQTLTGCIIVMQPQTGAILALAGRPTFDLNNVGTVPNKGVYLNPVVSDAWEPGSIFKILTMAAALDTGKINPRSTFVDRGTMRYFGVQISNRNSTAYGTITPAQILQYSSNVGTVQVANVLSTTAFYTYVHTAFGIGITTGVDLPFESQGMIRLPGDPYGHVVDLATHSYGQGLTATPLQMAAAVSAVANRGIMMRPYIISKISGTSDQTAAGPGPLRRVIKSDTAATLTEMLVSVIETTVKQARVPGYKLAGKTGTALIAAPRGSYREDETIASFIGYGPAENPQFLILVRIDLPRVHETGADAAAPVFRNIAQWLLAYMKIPPSDERAQR